MALKKENGIILALDVDSKEKALEICGEVADFVDAIKVGYPLVLKTGLSIVGELKQFKKPIITDFKVADIPIISQGICRAAVDAGADYVIVHGFVGEDVVKACSEAAKIFVVAEMSHPGATDFMADNAEGIAGIARKHAVGIVAPATRPERITELRNAVGDLIIISPGVKAQGASVGDAIRAGADFEIIGRGIYEAPDPRSAAEEYSRSARRAIYD
jgi:orotidine-5'-phosphate decarboxylase